MFSNNFFDKLQSCFCSLSSAVTALVKVTNYLLLASNTGLDSVLILCDVCSASDTVDHNVLIDYLKNYVLCHLWRGSELVHLSNRSFSVMLGTSLISCSLLFTMLLLGQIMHGHNIDFHCYADDSPFEVWYRRYIYASLKLRIGCPIISCS